ncbi:MAG TPA: nucleoside triphosphate pyrophosphohydrolase [Rhodobacteraceae bacterium]|mgnify:FL=1|jgi:ATP diphosphatase|nr:nucleoside triphosphate pyrophosphohydrolase [Paracoccaceae bacterium]HBM68664.1 nucleoside triphosphate pyrophosphohydrolase [Paracoccaceae bacterium]
MGFDKNIISDPKGGMPRLLEIMRALRDPETGCPWDIEQSFESIAPYTVEEAYEVADAIARKDWDDLRDELGDLLLQAVYHAQIAEEKNLFNFDDIANGISDKMLRRHPHVFGDESREKSSLEQTQDWEKLKAAERVGKAKSGTLDDVAQALPALMRAVKLQKRAARVGFDWPEIGHVLEKIKEEAAELVEAQGTSDQDHMAEEYGDLLFVMVNLGRHLNIDPEDALRQANAKFTRRFMHIENELNKLGKTPQSSSLTQMDAFWEEAKAREKRSKA